MQNMQGNKRHIIVGGAEINNYDFIREKLVSAVYVHAQDKSSGYRVQDVTISYNYIGILPANLLYDVMNGKAA